MAVKECYGDPSEADKKMDTIKELLASVRFQLAERLGNPLSGAFIVAWLVANFRLLLVLFSDGEWREKLRYIDATLYPDAYEWLRLGVFWPLIFALLYVFAYPFVAKKVIEFHRMRQKELREIAIRVEGETPITKEEKNRLLLKLRQTEANWRKQVEDLQAENQALGDALDAAQKASQAVLAGPKEGIAEEDEERPENSVPDAEPAKTMPTELRIDSSALLMGDSAEVATLAQRGVSFKMARVLDLLSEKMPPIEVRDVAKALGVLGSDADVLMKQMKTLGLLKEWNNSGGLVITDLGREVLQQLVDSNKYDRLMIPAPKTPRIRSDEAFALADPAELLEARISRERSPGPIVRAVRKDKVRDE